jgi:hypothetical protein
VGARTPEFENAALRALVSNWTASGILSARSGSHLTVTTTQDRAGTGIQNQRPDQLLDDVYGDGTPDNYLNPDAFAYAASGELGTHVRGSFDGPAYWSIDVALAKLVSFGGTQSVELRLETFNLLNRFNPADPEVRMERGTFGRITSQAGDPRILQFGIKYGF